MSRLKTRFLSRKLGEILQAVSLLMKAQERLFYGTYSIYGDTIFPLRAKVELYEIAGYGSARTLAELVKEQDVATLLQ